MKGIIAAGCVLCAAGNFALAALGTEFAPLNWTAAGFALGVGFADLAEYFFARNPKKPDNGS